MKKAIIIIALLATLSLSAAAQTTGSITLDSAFFEFFRDDLYLKFDSIDAPGGQVEMMKQNGALDTNRLQQLEIVSCSGSGCVLVAPFNVGVINFVLNIVQTGNFTDKEKAISIIEGQTISSCLLTLLDTYNNKTKVDSKTWFNETKPCYVELIKAHGFFETLLSDTEHAHPLIEVLQMNQQDIQHMLMVEDQKWINTINVKKPSQLAFVKIINPKLVPAPVSVPSTGTGDNVYSFEIPVLRNEFGDMVLNVPVQISIAAFTDYGAASISISESTGSCVRATAEPTIHDLDEAEVIVFYIDCDKIPPQGVKIVITIPIQDSSALFVHILTTDAGFPSGKLTYANYAGMDNVAGHTSGGFGSWNSIVFSDSPFPTLRNAMTGVGPSGWRDSKIFTGSNTMVELHGEPGPFQGYVLVTLPSADDDTPSIIVNPLNLAANSAIVVGSTRIVPMTMADGGFNGAGFGAKISFLVGETEAENVLVIGSGTSEQSWAEDGNTATTVVVDSGDGGDTQIITGDELFDLGGSPTGGAVVRSGDATVGSLIALAIAALIVLGIIIYGLRRKH